MPMNMYKGVPLSGKLPELATGLEDADATHFATANLTNELNTKVEAVSAQIGGLMFSVTDGILSVSYEVPDEEVVTDPSTQETSTGETTDPVDTGEEVTDPVHVTTDTPIEEGEDTPVDETIDETIDETNV